MDSKRCYDLSALSAGSLFQGVTPVPNQADAACNEALILAYKNGMLTKFELIELLQTAKAGSTAQHPFVSPAPLSVAVSASQPVPQATADDPAPKTYAVLTSD